MGHCCIDSPENDNKLKSGQFLKIKDWHWPNSFFFQFLVVENEDRDSHRVSVLNIELGFEPRRRR